MINLEEMAHKLEESGKYKILRAYQQPECYNPDDGSIKRVGVLIDTEDTGTDFRKDAIIELGMVKFEYSPHDGRIFRILETYDEYSDPGYPIPEIITRLTGITDATVKGKKIDLTHVKAFLKDVNFVIAHNAGFDRKFCEKLHPVFMDISWGCSMSDIDWSSEGIESRKLDYIASKLGFFFTGHRAINDCLATLHILSMQLPKSQTPALLTLLENARRLTYRIYALNSPYSAKDILKARGYLWNDGNGNQPKAWYVEVPQERKDTEIRYLYKEIYKNEPCLPQIQINAQNRYSDRI